MTTPPTNLYYLDGEPLTAFGSDTESVSATGATAVNAEQLASGEVCYKLNGDQTEINWYQTLPSSDTSVEADPYPVLFDTSLRVWFNKGLYTNEKPTGIETIKNEKLKIKNEIYDLSGRKIVNGKLPKGIYIQNGKKLIRK